MNGTRTALGIAAVLLVSLCAEPFALAQRRRRAGPQDSAPVQDDSTRVAREAYERGRAAFAAGNFQEALTAFQEAYAAKPHPTVLVSVAECQERLGQWTATVETLEQYLRDAPQARDRAAMEQKIAAIRARPGVLNITSVPAGARISLDGTDTGKVTPAELEAPAGEHSVRLTLEGRADAEERVTVSFADRHDLPMTLDMPQADEPVRAVAAADDTRSRTPPALYITAGVTGVGLVAGTVFGFLALSEKSDFDANPTAETADRGDRFALMADISFGVAVAAGIATAVLYFTRSGATESSDGSSGDDDAADDEDGDDDGDEPEEELDENYVRLRILPLATRRGGGVAAHLEF